MPNTSLPIAPAVRVFLGYQRPTNNGQLAARCPHCGQVHYHGVCGPEIGASDGEKYAHCLDDTGRAYFVQEITDPEIIKTFPNDIQHEAELSMEERHRREASKESAT